MCAALLLGVAASACGAPGAVGVTPADCGGCHVERHDEWQASAHGRSGTSPVFQALLPRVEAAWGATARARCVSCHQPEQAAIGCATCHLAVGNNGEANGALVVRERAGVGARAVVTTAPHVTVARGFFSSASLCGTCHEVKGPGHLDEPTLSEYRASPQAAEDSCARCHMEEGSHRFVGLSVTFGAPPAEQAEARAASVRLLQRALRLEVEGAVVRLSNDGAAHGVPTGMTALRDVWVDARVTFQDGRVADFPRVLELGARLERQGVEVALFTDATTSASRSLAAATQREWRPPSGDVVRVEAWLRARAIRAGALEALGLEALAAQAPQLEVANVSSPR